MKRKSGPVETVLVRASQRNIHNRCVGNFATSDGHHNVKVLSSQAKTWCMIGALSVECKDSDVFERALTLLESTKPVRYKKVKNLTVIHDKCSPNELRTWWSKAINDAHLIGA